MTRNLEDLTAALLDAARKAGADDADAMAVDGTSISIDVKNGVLEQAERSEGVDIGLRVIVGRKQACVSASDTRLETIAIMAERALAMAREAPDDPYLGLADKGDLATSWDVEALELYDPGHEPAAADLEEDARRAEAAAMAVSGIAQVQSASAGYGRRRVHLAASNGFAGGYTRSDRGTSCVAIAGSGTGMERDYAGESRIFQADLPSPESIGTLAGERTMQRMGARKPKTGAYPVIYDERVSSSLIGHLLGAINGSSVARGSSWLRSAMGELILPETLSIVEDPLRKRTAGSRPFDAEGLPATQRVIVENGVLKSWILDLATARQLGLQSTANAARGTSAPPTPSIGNVALTQGNQTLAQMICDMGTGLYVTSMIGSSINPTTGDYSRGASGFWIENGEIAYPVNECTLAGNLRDMLRTLTPANDARLHLSRVIPSLRVEGLILAGE
ncbi:peptidase PmbA [Aquimixticola soesokkakensis]|uniref:Peptidase PmbA n=1 Tax=Aquimixticola soesokkakensis TaxID=1519096 RepID=A0A1Y5TP29_9RHOB|nr:TldD/PmbA family protein [Aquimixticola soesokkakensis]SLN68744.1 peptidase PmbA [Aquimixticola soesokkakensis]